MRCRLWGDAQTELGAWHGQPVDGASHEQARPPEEGEKGGAGLPPAPSAQGARREQRGGARSSRSPEGKRRERGEDGATSPPRCCSRTMGPGAAR